MGIVTDTKASLARLPDYASRMNALLARHEVHGVEDLRRVAKEPSFRSEIATLWEEVLKKEGGKISLTLVLSTIALAMGGVGIAAGGGAIGLPLLVVLAPAGYFGGQELDSEGYTKAVVDRFGELLQLARKLDADRYARAAADEFNDLLQKVQHLGSDPSIGTVLSKLKGFVAKTKVRQC